VIVLDDQISNRFIAGKIAAWYPGAIVSIRESRPHGQILDPEVPTLLLKLRQPTFVTINYRDFFQTAIPARGLLPDLLQAGTTATRPTA
jgi:hypothetical protein